MNFLKQLGQFFTGGNIPAEGDYALYHYVKCRACGEIIRVRVNYRNEISTNDQGQRFATKGVSGQGGYNGKRCYTMIQATFFYDTQNRLINNDIVGGELVTAQDYETQQEKIANRER